MSDMTTRRIAVRVPELWEQIRQASRSQVEPVNLIRLALEDYLEKEPVRGSAYEAAEAAGLIGCVSRGPKDLSANRRYFEGFGKNRIDAPR